MKSADDRRPEPERRSLALQFLQLGSMNAVILMAWLAIGWLVDDRLGTLPIFILVGLLVGIACSCTVTYRLISQYFKD